jgi:uncharacterized protein YchJ
MAMTRAGVNGEPDGRLHASVLEQLDEHVWSAVRREGVDPQQDVRDQVQACWCDSGKRFVDCHPADQIDQPCGCGSGETFGEC